MAGRTLTTKCDN